MNTENGKDCNLCGDNPVELKLTLSNINTSEVLDKIDICRPCLKKYGNKLELQAGNK